VRSPARRGLPCAPGPVANERRHLLATEAPACLVSTHARRDAVILTGVIVRIWKANIDPARGDEYERFARERSLPMFRSHRGFRGCAFLRSGGDCVVVTLWDGPEDVAALEASHLYRTTVAAIMAAGFVRTAEEAIAVPVLL
jgi:heme-degrading monooxygenase HmoA